MKFLKIKKLIKKIKIKCLKNLEFKNLKIKKYLSFNKP
jgi:hypothetical protein